ncbi:hypothetical protein BDZ90DRAFT_230979 [Jaminaea rosea]|uniref:DUF1776-domain-containing protein n=1 Tax=Jaminaea rosea TaxID=1569628 RepID=A0A316UUJ4_9BASI|nr:hypothetical protein BDZ90DRAFT_230979 [Jaminaea rosea]PWN28980.1 hypothetical protein BDZ90DRAFT_230979 [Jaminaea rosea]
MQTLKDLEDWIETSIPSNLRDLPSNITHTVYSYSEAVYTQLTKYGNPLPSLQDIEDHLPGALTSPCKAIHNAVSPSPPPPPPPSGVWEQSTAWISVNRRGVQAAGGVAVIGIGTAWAYRSGRIWLPLLGRRSRKPAKALRTPLIKNGARKEAIVVLGGDNPLGRALALHMSSLGFVVIASVGSHSAVAAFNSIVPPSSRGYIKALQFETSDVAGSLPKFVRAVDEVLRLRFPLLSAGDPYAAPGDEVNLVGILNAISYTPPALDAPTLAGSSSQPSFQTNHAELADSLEKLVASPLCAISSLLPLLKSPTERNSSKSSREAAATHPSTTILSFLSSPVAHTSLPGAGVESVVSQAVVAGMEVIRREADEKALRLSTPSVPFIIRRSVRISTVEIDEGRPWGSAALPESESTTSSAAGRPGMPRKLSNASSWQARDAATQMVLAKVSSLLLTTDASARLRSSYRIYLPNAERHYAGQIFLWLNRATQRLMSVLPTGCIDVLLAMRRHVSLRRAGLISQGPRNANDNTTDTAQQKVKQSQLSQPSSRSHLSSQSPGAASPSHSRSSIRSSSATLSASQQRSGQGASHLRHPTSLSSEGEEEGTTSGPPSLPDSNSGESGSYHVDDDGMVSSGVLSSRSSQYEGQHGHTQRGAQAAGSEQNSFSSSATATGPWMGPASSRNSPAVPSSQSPVLEASAGGAQAGVETMPNDRTAQLGESWVRLGDSAVQEEQRPNQERKE